MIFVGTAGSVGSVLQKKRTVVCTRTRTVQRVCGQCLSILVGVRLRVRLYVVVQLSMTPQPQPYIRAIHITQQTLPHIPIIRQGRLRELAGHKP